MRAIVGPAVLPAAALAELKAWLGVTTAQDDGQLSGLLDTAVEVCGDYTGTVPLACTCEEVLPALADWQALVTRPVTGLVSVAVLATDGTRSALAAGGWDWSLSAGGTGQVRLRAGVASFGGTCGRIVVRVTAGLAAGWDALPEAIRHGLIRLAAHQYRARETVGALPLPPASAAALWRPWRRMRLG